MLGHRDWVEHVAFSADGQSLVSSSRDGTVKAWHVASGELLCELWNSHSDPPMHIAFSADGEQLAIRSEQGKIALLDTSRTDRSITIASSMTLAMPQSFVLPPRSTIRSKRGPK